jgi:hypothetical protein
MTWHIADWFALGIVVVGFTLDAWLFYFQGEPGTISYRVALWAVRWPVIPFLIGFLAGHLFWPNRGYCQ